MNPIKIIASILVFLSAAAAYAGGNFSRQNSTEPGLAERTNEILSLLDQVETGSLAPADLDRLTNIKRLASEINQEAQNKLVLLDKIYPLQCDLIQSTVYSVATSFRGSISSVVCSEGHLKAWLGISKSNSPREIYIPNGSLLEQVVVSSTEVLINDVAQAITRGNGRYSVNASMTIDDLWTGRLSGFYKIRLSPQ